MVETNVPLSKVDASKKGVVQSGWIGNPPVRKAAKPVETLNGIEQVEKKVYQQILLSLIPTFPVKKLEKQTLESVRGFFKEISPMIQDSVLEVYKNISP